jgi:hypothetical protein
MGEPELENSRCNWDHLNPVSCPEAGLLKPAAGKANFGFWTSRPSVALFLDFEETSVTGAFGFEATPFQGSFRFHVKHCMGAGYGLILQDNITDLRVHDSFLGLREMRS